MEVDPPRYMSPLERMMEYAEHAFGDRFVDGKQMWWCQPDALSDSGFAVTNGVEYFIHNELWGISQVRFDEQGQRLASVVRLSIRPEPAGTD